MLRQYLLHAPRECDSSAQGVALRAGEGHVRVWTSRSEGASESTAFHVANIPHLPASSIFQAHEQTLFPHARACASWCPGLWHLLCIACDRLEMWQLSLCRTKSGQSHNTQKHSSANATLGLHCKAQTQEVRARRPPPSPNFKCHAQRNGATWLTARLPCEDVSSF